MKLRENLASNLDRFFVGSAILLVFFSSYFLTLDFFLYFFVAIFIFYEIYKSVLKSKNITICLFLFFIILLLVNYFLITDFIFIIIVLSLFFLLSSIYFSEYFNIFFTLFIISTLILISNLFLIDRNIIYLIISASFINDTLAYIVGSNIKGPLITPKISPKKTWSGTSISFVITTFLFIYLDYNLFTSSIMAISLFYGDIYFSFIKRKLGIKDFSRMLSTHGGVLDRLDSITFLVIIFAILNI